MDIRIASGDITEVKDGTIFHQCNEGANQILATKPTHDIFKMYPSVQKHFSAWADGRGSDLGQVYFSEVTPKLMIANALTQFINISKFAERWSDFFEEALEITSLLVVNKEPEQQRIHIVKSQGEQKGFMEVVEKMAFMYPSITFVVWEDGQ